MALKWEKFKQSPFGTAWRSGLYKIIRWYADDRGNRVPQYQVEHGPSIINGKDVPASLARAKRIAEDHAQLQRVKAARRNPARTSKVVRDCGGSSGLRKRAKACRKVKDLGGRKGLRRMRQNPGAIDAQVRQAVARFTGFKGEAPAQVSRVSVAAPSRVMLTIGECIGIMYRTSRGGRTDNYLHRFKKSARPTLAVSSDGRSLYLLGGAYRVTDRGIEDA